MYEAVIDIFEIPEEARGYIREYLTEEELKAIEAMGRELHLPGKLEELLAPIVKDPAGFIKAAYARGTFNKAEEDGVIYFRVANFYRRLAYFPSYEPEVYEKIPPEVRKQWDTWYVGVYAEGAKPRLEVSLQDPTQLIENAFFYTLEETLGFLDELDVDEFIIVPCNCKAIALNCKDTKPRNVCLQFHKGINSEWDRGHGEVINKEQAKELVRQANKDGLMQTTEAGEAICNCCGCCCYPIRASELIGAKGLWPKKMYDIVWHEDKCIKCGKCAKACNFGAFQKDGKTITFDREKCWSCTICANHCPVGAITLEKAAPAAPATAVASGV